MNLPHYILVGDVILQVFDRQKFYAWYENRENVVIANDTFDGVTVSTVFLGFDHGFNSKMPVLFETMVFGGKLDGTQRRYETKGQAIAGHRELCEEIKSDIA